MKSAVLPMDSGGAGHQFSDHAAEAAAAALHGGQPSPRGPRGSRGATLGGADRTDGAADPERGRIPGKKIGGKEGLRIGERMGEKIGG